MRTCNYEWLHLLIIMLDNYGTKCLAMVIYNDDENKKLKNLSLKNDTTARRGLYEQNQ